MLLIIASLDEFLSLLPSRLFPASFLHLLPPCRFITCFPLPTPLLSSISLAHGLIAIFRQLLYIFSAFFISRHLLSLSIFVRVSVTHFAFSVGFLTFSLLLLSLVTLLHVTLVSLFLPMCHCVIYFFLSRPIVFLVTFCLSFFFFFFFCQFHWCLVSCFTFPSLSQLSSHSSSLFFIVVY